MAANSSIRSLTIENTRVDATERHALHVPFDMRASYVTLISGARGGAGILNEAIECSNNSSMVLDNALLRAIGDHATESCADGVYISSLIEAENGMGSGNHVCHISFNQFYAPLTNDCEAPPAP